MYRRDIFNSLAAILAEERKFIQVLAGPRQVGKTTLAKQILAQYPYPSHYASTDGVIVNQQGWIGDQFEIARTKMALTGAPEYLIVLDEIQKIDRWSEFIKQYWDASSFRDEQIKLLITGSSKLLLQDGLSESLMGRYELRQVGHWNYREMRDAFGLSEEQYVWFGGYPGAASLIGDETRWRDYILNGIIAPSVSSDILMMHKVMKPALLRRLFELGADYSGQILSFTKIMGQLTDAGNTTTLAHYLDLLGDAGLLSGLQKLSSTIQQRGSSPKFQVYNSALMTAMSSYDFNTARADGKLWGRHVESAIGSVLINHVRTKGQELLYWRDGNHEVDFVVRHRQRLIGIEVKSATAQLGSGVAAFQAKYNPFRMLNIGTAGLEWKAFLDMDLDKIL